MPTVGGAKNYNNAAEVARAGSSSSHRASPTRSYVMKQLGLQTPGFWADWAARRINPQQQEAATPASQSPSYAPITNMYQPQSWAAPTNVAAKPLDMSSGWRMPSEPAGGNYSNTGKTRKQLQDLEKQETWNQVRSRIVNNPFTSNTSLDAIHTESINMGRQMMIYMANNPSKMLTDAAMNYFLTHPRYSAINLAKTNFEKQVSLYSETKKLAEKTQGYAANEALKTVNTAIKQQKERGAYSSPAYMGGTMLNIGKGSGYNSTPYISPFG